MSRVSYAGTERLTVTRHGKQVRFEARALYTRNGPDGKSRGDARFVQVLSSSGLEDRVDSDPDFLTILNQPFAVWLDKTTLADLRMLRSRVPFSASSPLGDATVLRGFLRPGASGPIDGRPTVAVRFEAAGAISGDLPGHADGAVSGTMRMDGTAYYAIESAMLMALSVTLTLDAHLTQAHQSASVPLHITFHLQRVTERLLPQLREWRERQVVLVAVD